MLNTMVFRAQFVHGLIEVGDFRRSVHQKQLPIPVGLLHDGVGHSMQELNRRLYNGTIMEYFGWTSKTVRC